MPILEDLFIYIYFRYLLSSRERGSEKELGWLILLVTFVENNFSSNLFVEEKDLEQILHNLDSCHRWAKDTWIKYDLILPS